MNRLIRSVLVSGLAATSFAASAVTLSSIDFTPVSGSWGSSSVQLDFGAGYGLGTVSFTSVNGGAFSNAQTPFPYNDPQYGSPTNGPTLLSNGNLFAPTQESVFRVLSGTGPGVGGFTITVALDSGSFVPGSVFSVRSLAKSGTDYQYFKPGTGLGAPDSVQLPTDGVNQPDLVLVDSAQNLYGAASNTGKSNGLAFAITGTNSFTASFLSTAGFANTEGVAFTIALAPVPEPTTYALLLAGLGVIGYLARRRARAAR